MLTRGAAAAALALLLAGCAAGTASTPVPSPDTGRLSERATWRAERVLPDLAGDRITFPAWRVFCQRYPAECAPQAGYSVVPFAVAARVNAQANKDIHWQDDGINRWDVIGEVGTGDCEEYALTKRSRLRAMGYADSAMRLTIVAFEGESEHIVLVVTTEHGDVSLDSAYVHPVQLSRSRWMPTYVEHGSTWYPFGKVEVEGAAIPRDQLARGSSPQAVRN